MWTCKNDPNHIEFYAPACCIDGEVGFLVDAGSRSANPMGQYLDGCRGISQEDAEAWANDDCPPHCFECDEQAVWSA